MAQIKTGTVTVSNDSNIVTGSGTSWVGNVEIGDWFKVNDRPSIYQVASVESNIQIHLTENYIEASGSGLSYCIVTDFTPNKGVPLIFKGDIDWPDVFRRGMNIIDTFL
jgi:hypothetical protein